jgi:hypothetical protein
LLQAVAIAFLLEWAAPVAPTSALSEQLARLESVLPGAVLKLVVAASDSELDEFQTDDMASRILDGGAFDRDLRRLGSEAAADWRLPR